MASLKEGSRICYKCTNPIKDKSVGYKEFVNSISQHGPNKLYECVMCQLKTVDPTAPVVKSLLLQHEEMKVHRDK